MNFEFDESVLNQAGKAALEKAITAAFEGYDIQQMIRKYVEQEIASRWAEAAKAVLQKLDLQEHADALAMHSANLIAVSIRELMVSGAVEMLAKAQATSSYESEDTTRKRKAEIRASLHSQIAKLG